ncbi:MAG: hypothetical protein M1533_02585 [Candidatus Thermoplasmatota archaeon]|jgi:hypothetical protein|nr:hypothetical protein [Candidatus Thermoplasmatota archaeon]MCL5793327.1 hypothetical protein [Candidatus Thermoplasmatota archaeon]
MSEWRKEYDTVIGRHVYHCDEHKFHSHDPAIIETHLDKHGKKAAGFWEKKYLEEQKTTVYHCKDHKFRTSDPMEIEEHERVHMAQNGVAYPGWGL